MKIKPPASKSGLWKDLTAEERRERRRLRREKQREDNLGRAAKMHLARLKTKKEGRDGLSKLEASVHVGCSGWRYWKWRDSFYAGVPQPDWFEHYLKDFDTVEINASFYSWPTVASVQAWRRQPGDRNFIYTVKVCEIITHVKRFRGTKTLVKDFGLIADILGDRMGCLLFQLPPSYRYTRARLDAIVGQLDPARRNVFGLIAAHPDLARGGIRLRQFGQEIIEALGGRKIHPAYLLEVKKPAESKYPWDYYKIRATIPADQAFRPEKEGGCSLIK